MHGATLTYYRQLFLSVLFVTFQQVPGGENLPLSSLVQGCEIHKGWIGDMQMLPNGAWLHCGDKEVLMTHPLNLLRLVDIKTPEQALEFVRFFTSERSHLLFPYVGMVEILPDNEERVYGLAEDVFDKHFKRATARAYPSLSEPTSYYITRTVLRPDGTVAEISEGVNPDGFYGIISEKVLIEDSRTLGLSYIGNRD